MYEAEPARSPSPPRARAVSAALTDRTPLAPPASSHKHEVISATDDPKFYANALGELPRWSPHSGGSVDTMTHAPESRTAFGVMGLRNSSPYDGALPMLTLN